MITTQAPTELAEILSPFFIEGVVPIAQSTLTGTAASVTFSSIPDDFRHLLIYTFARSDDTAEGDNIDLIFNADTGANYSWQQIYGNAAATTTQTQRGQTEILTCFTDAANATASSFAPGIIWILNYNLSSKLKHILSYSCHYGDVSADADIFTGLRSGRWATGDAITSVTLTPTSAADWDTGCVFQLYGIR